jgi:hypothetical protein
VQQSNEARFKRERIRAKVCETRQRSFMEAGEAKKKLMEGEGEGFFQKIAKFLKCFERCFEYYEECSIVL